MIMCLGDLKEQPLKVFKSIRDGQTSLFLQIQENRLRIYSILTMIFLLRCVTKRFRIPSCVVGHLFLQDKDFITDMILFVLESNKTFQPRASVHYLLLLKVQMFGKQKTRNK